MRQAKSSEKSKLVEMQKSEKSFQRIMTKSTRILSRHVMNTGRSWKLKDQRN